MAKSPAAHHNPCSETCNHQRANFTLADNFELAGALLRNIGSGHGVPSASETINKKEGISVKPLNSEAAPTRFQLRFTKLQATHARTKQQLAPIVFSPSKNKRSGFDGLKAQLCSATSPFDSCQESAQKVALP